jgi:hypothetical protein
MSDAQEGQIPSSLGEEVLARLGLFNTTLDDPIEALRSPLWTLRVQAILQLAKDAGATTDPNFIAQFLADHNMSVRAAAIKCFLYVHPTDSIIQTIGSMWDSAYDEVREAILELWQVHHELLPESLVIASMQDASYSFTQIAAIQSAKFMQTLPIQMLLQLWRTEKSFEIRLEALTALIDNLLPQQDELRYQLLMEALLDRNQYIIQFAVLALTHRGADVVQILTSKFAHSGLQSKMLRSLAVAWELDTGVAKKEILETVQTFVLSEYAVEIKIAAIMVLAKKAPPVGFIVDLYKHIHNDEVRAVAFTILEYWYPQVAALLEANAPNITDTEPEPEN